MVSPKNIEITVSRVAAGGDGIGIDDDGRVVFVPGALPGERVAVEITRAKKRFANARLLGVIEAAPGRQDPPCPHVADGCGGCDWQHATNQTQSGLRLKIAADSLERLGRLDRDLVASVVEPGPPLDPSGYRSTVRALVSKGRAGYRMAGSHEPILVSSCLVAHPLVSEILTEGRFPNANEVMIRVGANTGERMVLVSPTAKGVVVPSDVLVVGQDDLDGGASAFIHEEVGGKRFRISAQSFFQSRSDGALALADLASEMIAEVKGPLLDAYCGVGLFGSLCGHGRSVTGVEINPVAVADARINLPEESTLISAPFSEWDPSPFNVVIADPARAGLGASDVAVLAATNAEVIVLVSCDPASLGRDAGLLTSHGYELKRTAVLDLFGQTSHIECISQFQRNR